MAGGLRGLFRERRAPPATPTPWMRPVFLLANGRSGSTLLMRMVNCLDGITVWGEHGGIVRNLREAYESLTREPFAQLIEQMRPAAVSLLRKETPATAPRGAMTTEWANSFRREDVVAATRECLVRLLTVGLPPERRWGFKEIRYARPDYEFLRRMFPHAQIVLLTRDPAAVLRSQFANFAAGDAAHLPTFLQMIADFLELARTARHEPSCRWVDYARLLAERPAVMRELAEFLGARANADAAAAVIAEPPRKEFSPYRDGGPDAVCASLTVQFEQAGAVPDPALIARVAALYHDVRTAAHAPTVESPDA